MFLRFYEQAWQDYLYWFKTDQKTCKRIHKLIRDTKRSPFAGLGKPEALKRNHKGFWSRRVDDEHRMIYGVTKNELVVVKLRYHY
ncbi:MAG: Txe/YoeB family addiction module toxin [Deinococcota bacterium]